MSKNPFPPDGGSPLSSPGLKPGASRRHLVMRLDRALKVSKQTDQVYGRDNKKGLLRRVLASGDPYPVEMLRRQVRHQVRITVEEGNPQAFATLGQPNTRISLHGAQAAPEQTSDGRNESPPIPPSMGTSDGRNESPRIPLSAHPVRSAGSGGNREHPQLPD